MNNKKITAEIKRLDAQNIENGVKTNWLAEYGQGDYSETLECVAAVNLIMKAGKTGKLLLFLKQEFPSVFTERDLEN